MPYNPTFPSPRHQYTHRYESSPSSRHFSLSHALHDLCSSVVHRTARERVQALLLAVKKAITCNVNERVSITVIDQMLLRFDELAIADPSSITSIDIVTLWHSAGLMAKHKLLSGTLEGSNAIKWLNILQQKRDLANRGISSMLLSLGQLACHHHISTGITREAIESLTSKLYRPDGQTIANTVYGLGLLARAGKLTGQISAAWLDYLVATMLDQNGYPSEQHIANTLYGLGLLAGSGKLSGQLSSNRLVGLIDNLLDTRNRTNDQGIGNCIHGLGSLASAGNLDENIPIEPLNHMLTKLLNNCAHPSEQAIANCIHGLGALTKAEKLTGTMTAALLDSLLGGLLTDNSHHVAQHISNSIWGLGLLARDDKLTGHFPSENLNHLLDKLLDKNRLLNTQHIANTLYGLGLLAQSGKLSGDIPAQSINYLVTKLLDKQASPNQQELSTSLYGLAQLARAGKLTASLLPENLNQLIMLVGKNRNVSEQRIGNAIHSIGLLAQAGKVSGDILAEHFDTLINNLTRKLLDKQAHPIEQEIANSLYGYGLIARAGKLTTSIPTEHINLLVSSLLDKDSKPSEQHVTNSIYGLGLLASSNKLTTTIHANHLNEFMSKMLGRNADPSLQMIANIVYGLGLLANKNKLTGNILHAPIIPLLYRLSDKNTNPSQQLITNALYGLGLLANAGKLTGHIPADCLHGLTNKLLDRKAQLTDQGIANTFYSLGLLARADKLTESISAKFTHYLIIKSLDENARPSEKMIASIIYGLGLLAQADKLSDSIMATLLNDLIGKLSDRNARLSEQEIANTLYGLGLLAGAGMLDGQIVVEGVNHLVNQMLNNDGHPTRKAIVSSIHGLGLLTQQGVLSGAVVGLIPLLRLYAAHIRTKPDELPTIPALLLPFIQTRIAQNSIYSQPEYRPVLLDLIGLCMARGPALSFVLSVKVLAICTLLLEQQSNQNLPDCPLSGYVGQLYHRWHAANPDCLPSELQSLFRIHMEKALPYLTPARESRRPSSSYTDLNDAASFFTTTRKRIRISEIDADPVSKKHCDRTRRSDGLTVRKKSHALDAIPVELLQRVKRESSIYKFIYNQDLAGLQALLNACLDTLPTGSVEGRGRSVLSAGRSGQQQPSGSRHSNDNDRLSRLHRDHSEADALVKAFFTKVNPHAMQALVCAREASWFCHLVKACSISQRHKLASQHHLYMVIMNLELDELKVFIASLMGEGISMYVDHRSILALLDNLTERSACAQVEDIQTIQQLQSILLDKAIAFHQGKKHPHVTERLKALRWSFAVRRQLTLNDTNEFEEEIDESNLSEESETPSPTTGASDSAAGFQPSSPSREQFFFNSARSETATIGDGNCLFNTVAIGLIENNYLARFHRVWGMITTDAPMSFVIPASLSPTNQVYLHRLLEALGQPEGHEAFYQTLQERSCRSAADAQRLLAPLLRHVAYVYMLKKRQALAGQSALYLIDDVTASQILRLDEQHEHMALARIPFIRDKVRELMNVAHLNEQDQVQPFIAWWNESGEEQYIRYMAQSAEQAGQRERWGSEIELAVLCECLGITVKYVHGEQHGLLGCLAGRRSKDELIQLGCTQDTLNLLKELNAIDELCYFNFSTGNWVTEGYRFNENTVDVLETLRQLPLFHKKSDQRLHDLSPSVCVPIVAYIHQRAHSSGITPLKVMEQDSVRFGPKTIQPLQARRLLTDSGYFVGDETQPDYSRILRGLTKLSETSYNGIKNWLLPITPLFIATLNDNHWAFETCDAGEHTAHRRTF